ncbi:Flagellar assembly factor FliW [Desulfamplus magnetovallimortis]|uniref:Flagellar assembly factor FliW n=1 Tax=Desulfamplus magnetovallimortis TaxID=1246637 RepID=A0A1W1H9U0_9BACT|nr:flagellar assembly protein FliW [Desulfamplus magnetovallimortis]SLM29213.1 Flagellar assembly factor FliW [Desulfamplus magnetovallimortis]
MKIKTRKFGDIEIDDDQILTMPEGLPGFPGFDLFVVLERPETAPFCWLQCIQDPNLNLVMMNPYYFMPDYDPDLDAIITIRNWHGVERDDFQIYVVVNIFGEGEEKKITANLMGPIVINRKSGEAVQFVLSNSCYSHQHNILKSMEERYTRG